MDPRDTQYYVTLNNYFKNQGEAADGLHNRINAYSWWCWNANSADTKGIVFDDWTSINWQKVQLLQTLFDLSPWYGSAGAAAIESVGSAVVAASRPFPIPIHGIEWDLATLNMGSSKRTGDFVTILQSILALGFDTIVLPFSFNDLTSPSYLKDLPHPCAPTDVVSLKRGLLPMDMALNDTVIMSYSLPKISGIYYDLADALCNDFDAGVDGEDRFIYMIRVMLTSGARVVLRNQDAFAAMIDPDDFFLRWVHLAGNLNIVLGALTSRLVVDIIDTSISPMQWISASGVPGLSEIYRAILPVLYPLLEQSQYFIEGVGGSDFESGNFYFKNLLTEPWAMSVVPFSSNLPFQSLDNLSSSLTYVSDPGICLTAESCQALEYVVEITHSNFSDMSTPVLTSTSWILADDPTRLSADAAANLNRFGLVPWYTPRSGYNPLSVPTVQGTTAVEAAVEENCTVIIRLSDYDANSVLPFTAVASLAITNGLPTTVFPPWTLNITDPAIQSLIFNFDGEPSLSSNSISLTFPNTWDVLWPAYINTVEKLIVMQLAPLDPVLSNTTVSIDDKLCNVSIMYK